MRLITKYLAVLRLGWVDAVEYRTEFFVSIIGWGLRLFIALYLWLAVAETQGGTIGPYTLKKIMAYFFIVQIISSFTFSRVGFDIARDIYRGDFANFLLKPMNYILFRLIQEISKNAFRTVLSLLIFGTLLFSFFGGIPFALWKIPLGLIAIGGAYLVNFMLVCLIVQTAFWITNSTRFMFIYFGILTIFSGLTIPVDLFPPTLRAITESLPFPYVFYFPAKVIQAETIFPELFQGLAIQWSYVVFLTGLATFMFNRGVRHFESVGR